MVEGLHFGFVYFGGGFLSKLFPPPQTKKKKAKHPARSLGSEFTLKKVVIGSPPFISQQKGHLEGVPQPDPYRTKTNHAY